MAIPMEAERLNVKDEDVRAWFASLSEAIDGVPAHFILNMDEMGHQEYADAKQIPCIVPAYATGTPHYEVSRRGKRITLIACVAADGSYCRPALVITRATYDDELIEYGFTPEKLEIYSQGHAYIDKDIFYDWMKDTLVPDLQRRRVAHDYWGPAFLLLDSCSAHFGPDVTDISEANNLKLLYIPAHSSHFLQCLDVCVFGVAKRLIRKINRTEAVNVQTSHIIQLVNGFLSAAVPTNIVKSFRNVGISLKRIGLEISCKTTPDTVRLWRDEALAEEGVISAEEEHPEEAEETLDFEGYAMNCAVAMSGGEEEEGRPAGD
jgi:hypothetical protein